jgi:DNA repair protein RadD
VDLTSQVDLPLLWDHQSSGIIRASEAVRNGARSLCVVAATGSGKTRCMAEISARAAERNKKVLLVTHRKILLAQTRAVLHQRGVKHGVMAADYDSALLEDIQLGSIGTIGSRVFSSGRWQLPDADLVLVDEAHSNTTGHAKKLIEHYRERGSVLLGFTATPVGLSGLYDGLVEIAKNTELANKGILVNGTVYAPDEPDMQGIAMSRGEFNQTQASKRVMDCICVGDVFEHFIRLNPKLLPTVLFAPGIQESAYFAKQFTNRGIPAAHMDGSTPAGEREDIFGKLRSGELVLISSCGVLREGWDFPQVAHGILVQCCGALSTYLQIVGRLKRSAAGKVGYTLQDHSGAWWRHGSPDEDRVWTLGATDAEIAKKHKKACQDGEERQPIRCPNCSAVRLGGPECPFCGHKHKLSVRMVHTIDGRLVRVTGDAIKRKRAPSTASSDEKCWKGCFFKAVNAKKPMTFKQAAFIFSKIRGHWPPQGLWNMPPRGSLDWDRRVVDVYPRYRRPTVDAGN